MAKSSINGSCSMAMLNNQMVYDVPQLIKVAPFRGGRPHFQPHGVRSVTLDFIQVAYKYWSAYFSTIYQAGFDGVISLQYHIEMSLPFCCLE